MKPACHAYTSRNDYLAMNLKVPDCIGKADILSLKINTVTWEFILGLNKEEAYIHRLDRRLEVFGLGIDNARQRLIMMCISCIKLVSNNSTQLEKVNLCHEGMVTGQISFAGQFSNPYATTLIAT